MLPQKMLFALTMTDFSDRRFYEFCQAHINVVSMGMLINCYRKSAVFCVLCALHCDVQERNLLFNGDLLSYFVNVNSEAPCYIISLVFLFVHLLNPYILNTLFSENLDLSLRCN
jgi:hypothetical protein